MATNPDEQATVQALVHCMVEYGNHAGSHTPVHVIVVESIAIAGRNVFNNKSCDIILKRNPDGRRICRRRYDSAFYLAGAETGAGNALS